MQASTDQKEIYNTQLQANQWLERRQQILTRDNHRCVRCGSSNQLNVHHRQYHTRTANGQFVEPWNYKSHNLITLCRSCHQLGHKLFKVPVFNV